MRRPAALGALSLAAAAAFAGLSGSYIVPLDHAAIQYNVRPVTDAVARLNEKIARGEVKLAFDSGHGYLRSVLDQFKVPVESQVLVFSKTSFQAPRISPRMPRALYFNDSIIVGWVQGGDVVEIAAVDPQQGVIFYTLDQESSPRLRFERRDTCLQCHDVGATLGVPGLVVRSVYVQPSGMPLFHAGGFITDHRSPLEQRWGGWYVTGTHGSQRHLGNALARNPEHPDQLDTEGTQNVTDLSGRLDTARYLAPTSDLVGLMVLEHQTHMTNLITRVGFEVRMALHDQAALNQALHEKPDYQSETTRRRIDSAVEEMLEYMLFIEETRLTEPVRGVSGFARRFTSQGPRDPRGRSLRDLDLRTRLLRYPLSFLIYSEAFDGMPAAARERLYRRLYDVLTGRDSQKKWSRLSAADREAVFEILAATKRGLPDYWTQRAK